MDVEEVGACFLTHDIGHRHVGAFYRGTSWGVLKMTDMPMSVIM